MNYVTVNYSVNQSYSISKHTFVQLVNNCINDTSFIKLSSEPKIVLIKKKNNVGFIINIEIKKGKNISTVINNFINELEMRFLSLLDLKPASIKICFNGTY
ncbi:MMB_0454 family protein [Mycoplasmopsis meleagridis]|uniref:MMB_0454 family protein n=1 Tax=Mycoplasmopsis meleagridis TaxID=29561 RepID=UPI003A8B2600